MARWLHILSGSKGAQPPDRPRDPGGERLLLRVAEARIREVAAKIQLGEAIPEDLKQLAIAALGDAMTLARDAGEGSTKPRDQVRASAAMARASNVVRQWLADEKDTPGGGRITAIQIIMNQPAALPAAPGARDNGHARAGPVETNGLRVRLDRDDPG